MTYKYLYLKFTRFINYPANKNPIFLKILLRLFSLTELGRANVNIF